MRFDGTEASTIQAGAPPGPVVSVGAVDQDSASAGKGRMTHLESATVFERAKLLAECRRLLVDAGFDPRAYTDDRLIEMHSVGAEIGEHAVRCALQVQGRAS